MKQWWIWLDNDVVHKPDTNEWNVTKAVLSLEVSAAGKLEFELPKSHPLYDRIAEMPCLTNNWVRVERDGEEVWRGRILAKNAKPLSSTMLVTCEGELALLNDSVMHAYTWAGSPKQTVFYYLNAHNAQVDSWKRIYTGRVDIVDKGANEYIVRESQSDVNMWDEFRNKTVKSSDGGYLMLRRVNGNRYLDWVQDPAVPGNQEVRFAFNLLDIEDRKTGEGLVTAIKPKGATETETVDGQTVTTTVDIESEGDFDDGTVTKRGPYMINNALAEKHGFICDTVVWEDVTLSRNLLTKARNYTAALTEPRMVKVRAIDMTDAGYEVDEFKVGQTVRLYSPTVTGSMLVTAIKYDLLNPTGGSITFGDLRNAQSARGASSGGAAYNVAAQAERSAQGAVAIASGKNTTYRQETAPTNAVDGDLWFSTGESNNPYRMENGQWVDIQSASGPETYASSPAAAGNADKANALLYGTVDSSSTSTAFTATVPGLTELVDGTVVVLKNGVVTSAADFTIDVNGLGAKPVYSNMAAATRETTIFNANYTLMFIYDSARVSGGCWVNYRGYYSDANSVGYQLRTNNGTLPASDKFYRYRILFTSADGKKWVPSNTSTSTNATARRDVNQRPIDPFGPIVYYSTTAVVEADANPGPTYLWQQYTLVLGYSFNRSGAALTLTPWAPVYIKCAPQADGSAIVDADSPYVQALPSTADGKVYIYLGIAFDATHVELRAEHPVYFYSDGAIRLWDNKSSTDALTNTDIETLLTNAG